MSGFEDDDLKRAIAMSLNDHKGTQPMDLTGDESTAAPTATVSAPVGILGLDRKAMERERLARQAQKTGKRARSISPPPMARPSKVTKVSSPPIAPVEFSPQKEPALPSPKSVHTNITGCLYKTWAFGHARVPGRDIKFEEVIERRTLRTAVLSAFQWDYEWLFTKLDTKKTKFVLVSHARFPEERRKLKTDLESLGPNVKVCLPPMDGVYCMHSKLMLLFHEAKLRVVIPSANLLPFDWGETGVMENTVWLIDLPRRASTESVLIPDTPFYQELEFFLRKQELPVEVIDGLKNFDWSATKPYAFVASIGKNLYGADMAHSGLLSLSTAVRTLDLRSKSPQVDMCSSSVGALKIEQIANLYAASSGHLTPSAPLPATAVSKDLAANFRFYFPTYDYVAGGTGGVNNGGTIWLKEEHYNRQAFPKHLFREYLSTRPKLLSHCKMIFLRGFSASPPKVDTALSTQKGSSTDKKAPSIFDRPAKNEYSAGVEDRDQRQIAWVYAGSANCSESAWGAITTPKSGPDKGRTKIFCRNWECGVVIPVLDEVPQAKTLSVTTAGSKTAVPQKEKERDPDETESETEDEDEEPAKVMLPVSQPDWDVFGSIIDGPFQFPAPEMGKKLPWFVEEHLIKPMRRANAAERSVED